MFKEMFQDFLEFREWLAGWSFCKRQSVKMGLAIRLADAKQKAFNRQYHIMILCLPGGEKPVSVSRDDILKLKRKKWLPKDTSVFSLTHSDSIFYSTPVNRNNKSTKEERRSAMEKYLKYSKKYMKQ